MYCPAPLCASIISRIALRVSRKFKALMIVWAHELLSAGCAVGAAAPGIAPARRRVRVAEPDLDEAAISPRVNSDQKPQQVSIPGLCWSRCQGLMNVVAVDMLETRRRTRPTRPQRRPDGATIRERADPSNDATARLAPFRSSIGLIGVSESNRSSS